MSKQPLNRRTKRRHEFEQLPIDFEGLRAANKARLRHAAFADDGPPPPKLGNEDYAAAVARIYNDDQDATPPQPQPPQSQHLPNAQLFSAVTTDPQPDAAGE